VNRDNGSLANIPVVVERASDNAILGKTRTGSNGEYTVEFAAKGTINAVYGNAIYLPETIRNLSGETDHELTKVLLRNEPAARLTPEQGVEIVATLEHMRNNPGNFESDLLEIGLTLNESIFPASFQSQISQIKVTATEIAKRGSSSRNLSGTILRQEIDGRFTMLTTSGPIEVRLFNDALCGNKVDGILKRCDSSLAWRSGNLVGQRVEVDAFLHSGSGLVYADRVKVPMQYSF
jgi:hypothetical protein